jgi:hypothetical protein
MSADSAGPADGAVASGPVRPSLWEVLCSLDSGVSQGRLQQWDAVVPADFVAVSPDSEPWQQVASFGHLLRQWANAAACMKRACDELASHLSEAWANELGRLAPPLVPEPGQGFRVVLGRQAGRCCWVGSSLPSLADPLWLALFQLPSLRRDWRRRLRHSHWRRLMARLAQVGMTGMPEPSPLGETPGPWSASPAEGPLTLSRGKSWSWSLTGLGTGQGSDSVGGLHQLAGPGLACQAVAAVLVADYQSDQSGRIALVRCWASPRF